MDKDFWDYLEGYLLMEKFETDRFLTDFSRAWSKQDIDAELPRYAVEEAAAYFKAQKATSTMVALGEGDLQVQWTDTSERFYIITNRGTAEIGRDDLPDLIRVLQGLVKGPTAGGALNAPQVASAPREIPQAVWNGMTASQQLSYKNNMAAMEKAMGIRHR